MIVHERDRESGEKENIRIMPEVGEKMSLSSEGSLLLYCARTNMNDDIIHKVKGILNNCLDWDYIVKSSMRRHGISPLLYWNLSRIDNGESVPEEVMAKLRKLYYENVSRNRLLYDELSEVLKAFKDAGIDVIVLKGAFLAEAVYKNISLRPMKDIDLLIKKEDLQKVKEGLSQLMYRTPVCPTKWHEKFYMRWQIESAEEIHCFNQDKNIRIDVHWDIQPPSSPFQIDIDTFWENAQSVKIAGVETLVFAPEDLLQHLCLHLDKEINKGKLPLRWYCDIAEVIRYYEEKINWKYLIQSSKNYGIEEPIYRGLYLVNKYFGGFVPMDVLDDLKTVKSNPNFEDIFRKSTKGDLKKKKQWKEINYLKRLTKVDGIWNKAHILFGDVFPSKEFMMQRYQIQNKKVIVGYYVIRFCTAFQWGIHALWQLLLYPFKLKSEKV